MPPKPSMPRSSHGTERGGRGCRAQRGRARLRRAGAAIHGLAADAEGMAPVAQALGGDARVIGHDRRGYGSSGAPEPIATTGRGAGGARRCAGGVDDAGAAVVCGDGFGALVALDLRSATTLCSEPAALHVRPLVLAAQHAEMEVVQRAQGGPAAGVEAWLGVRAHGPAERARSAYQAFFADYGGAGELAGHPGASCARWTCPPSRADHGRPHVVAAADVLAGPTPAARRADDGDLVGRRAHAARVTLTRVAGSVKAHARLSPCSPRCWRSAAPGRAAAVRSAAPVLHRRVRRHPRARARDRAADAPRLGSAFVSATHGGLDCAHTLRRLLRPLSEPADRAALPR